MGGLLGWDPVFINQLGREDITLIMTNVSGTGSNRRVYGTMTQMRKGTPLFRDSSVTGTAEASGDTIAVKLITHGGQRLTLVLRGDLLQGDRSGGRLVGAGADDRREDVRAALHLR
jgi:hypothetical protein